MDHKKALKIWASISLAAFFFTWYLEWSNHPSIVSFYRDKWLFFLLPVLLLGWFFRSKALKAANDWAGHLSAGFLLQYLAQKGFPKVHAYNEAQQIMWIAIGVSTLFLALLLWWDFLAEKIRKSAWLAKIPLVYYLLVFLAACVAVWFLKGWEGRYVMTFLGLSPLLRYAITRRNPEVLKAFALFLGADVLFANWKPRHEALGFWAHLVICHHLLLATLLFVYWEKLKEAVSVNWRWALLAYAVLPMIPYYYLGYGNWTWPIFVVILGVIWGWNPWLKPHKIAVFLGLFSLTGLILLLAPRTMGALLAILVMAWLTSEARRYFLKLPADRLKVLALYTLSGFFYLGYPLNTSFFYQRGGWVFACHLLLSGLAALYWEKLRDRQNKKLRRNVLLYALLPGLWAVYKGSFIWFLQALVLTVAWAYDAFGLSTPGARGKAAAGLSSKLEILGRIPWVKKTIGFLTNMAKKTWQGIVSISKQPKVRKAALGLIVLAVLGFAATLVYNAVTTRVVSFTPTGLVTTPNVVITARFSGEVSAVGSLDSAFQIDPPLAGVARLADSKTLVFGTDKGLKPATTYKVRLSTKGLKGKQWFLQGSAFTAFATEPLKVVSSRLFYTYDLVKGTEKELMGELDFNYPVNLEQLKQNLTVLKEGNKVNFELEQGSLPTRFYFRAGGLERLDKQQTLKVVIAPELTCQECTKPLGVKFEKNIVLEPRPKLLVEEVKLHHVPGNTLISVLFTLPVSSTQARNNITIEPTVPFKVDTEYCYAVLKADFQPNTDYKVKVRKGITAMSGQVLEDDREQDLRLRDVNPYVRFADSGRYIPVTGGKNVAIKTMNLDTFTVGVEKVFRNNIVEYLKNNRSYNSNRFHRRSYDEESDGEEGDGGGYEMEYGNTAGNGSQIYSGSVTVEGGEINQEVFSALDFAKWHEAPYKGLFKVTLQGSEGGGSDSRTFLCTDLGLLMKRSGEDLWVQALSVSTLEALSGVRLQLVSNNNQVIQERETDAEGRVWFKNWKNNPYNFQPFVVIAQKGDDWSYLRTDQESYNQARFDVGGDPFTSTGWDAFLTSERGLYRPGEKAFFTGVVRHADLETAGDLPVKLTIRDSSGNEVGTFTSKLKEFGMVTFEYEIKNDSPTGRMTAELGMENGVQLASAEFKVEEFIPNKIKVEVNASKKTAAPGEQIAFTVQARQLFGAPGVNLRATARAQLSHLDYTNKKWEGYHFADYTRHFVADTLRVPDGFTDGAGKFDVQLPVPLSMLPPSMIQAVVYAEVMDTGGRPVGANATINVHRYPYYLGLKCKEGKVVSPQTKVHIQYVAVSPEGDTVNVKKITLMVKRKVWYSIFRRSGWAGRGWESAFYEQVTEAKEIDIDGKGTYSFTPDKSGEYTVYLGNEESMRSSLLVTVAGAGVKPEESASTGMEEPEKLSLTLNQARYQLGETPKLEVRAPFAGKLVLSLEREQVFTTLTRRVEAGLNVIDLPAVESSYLPNVYVVGLLVRKPDVQWRNLPMASFGVAPLNVNTADRQISFKWDVPESVKSRQGIDVSLDTGTPGAKVVLAAVDEGILQIIAFTTPDPFKHFYRKRGLTTSTLSLFDEILPDLDGKQALGGDEGENFQGRHLNPIAAKRVVSFAYYSGILTADSDGKVKYRVPTDKFHGEVRLMALGVNGKKFGASAFHVKVADTVVVEPSFPRFMAPGDRIEVPVLIFNNTKEKQNVSVALSGEGPVEVTEGAKQSVSLEEEGQKQILFHAKAKMDAGVARFKVRATDAGGENYDVDTELAVRPGNPLTTEIKFGPLGAGATQTLPVPGGFISQGQRVRLAVSSNPLLTFLGCLDYLIRYPYGCAEQKTSTAFPLLYFKDIGLLTGRFPNKANAVETYVQAAIDDVSKQQLSDGSFAYWPGSQESGGDWLFYYVSHFFLEAQKQGYQVNQTVMERILNRLGAIQVQGKKVGRLDRRKQNVEVPDSAYVLYLKVLAGKPDVESMAAFKGDLAKRKDTYRKITDQCLLSLAYSTLGDRTTALSVLPAKFLPSQLQRELNGMWFSPNREMALYLLALVQGDPQSKEIPNILVEFGRRLRGDGYFGTTQEDAWCFMALGRAVKATAESFPLNAQWAVQGGEVHPLSGETAVVKEVSLSGKTVVLKNNGTRGIYYHLMAEGTKLESKKEDVAKGITVKREYRDEKGNTVNLGAVAQGQLVVVTIRVKAAKFLDNLIIVDLLPAGFEVDNPRLSSRGSLGFEPQCDFSTAFSDFRDDRVLLFSKSMSGEQAFSYSVRAVTPGEFQVPGLTAEAMYDPEIFGRTNTGETLIIAPAKY